MNNHFICVAIVLTFSNESLIEILFAFTEKKKDGRGGREGDENIK